MDFAHKAMVDSPKLITATNGIADRHFN